MPGTLHFKFGDPEPTLHFWFGDPVPTLHFQFGDPEPTNYQQLDAGTLEPARRKSEEVGP